MAEPEGGGAPPQGAPPQQLVLPGVETFAQIAQKRLQGKEPLTLGELYMLRTMMREDREDRERERAPPKQASTDIAEAVSKGVSEALENLGVVKSEMPDWAKQMQQQQSAILEKLHMEETDRKQKEFAEEISKPLLGQLEKERTERQRLEKTIEDLQLKLNQPPTPPPAPPSATDLKIKELPQLREGLQTIGLDITKQQAETTSPDDSIEAQLYQVGRDDVVPKIKEAVRKGLLKEEEVVDTKTGKINVYSVLNRLAKVAERYVEKMPTTAPEERRVREIIAPQGAPEAARLAPPQPPVAPPTQAPTPPPAPSPPPAEGSFASVSVGPTPQATITTTPTTTPETVVPQSEAQKSGAKQPEAQPEQPQAGAPETTEPAQKEG